MVINGIRSRSLSNILFLLCGSASVSAIAHAQITLTGVADFAATPSGATSVEQGYADGFGNTLGGDQWWNIWIALNPDATSPLNGPSDEQASIAIPLQAGNAYKYYLFGSGVCCTLPTTGLNLFFDGNEATPNISVFVQNKSLRFVSNVSSTLSLQGNPAQGSGTSYYSSAGVIVVLTEFVWDGFQIPPGNVAQPFVFSPNSDGEPSSYGSMKLRVFPAAVFNISEPSASPFSKLTLNGSGFRPGEEVDIYSASIETSPLAVAGADVSGSFSATILEPQHAYGPLEFFALGQNSGTLGATQVSVFAAVVAAPKFVRPSGTVAAQGLGFGAGEMVAVYIDIPRELLGTATADQFGSFTGDRALAVTIPASTSLGSNGLIAIGGTTGAIGIGKLTVE